MKDYNGRELKVGDYVSIVEPRYRNLVKGRITRFCNVLMKVEYFVPGWCPVKQKLTSVPREIKREPSYVAYLGEPDDTPL